MMNSQTITRLDRTRVVRIALWSLGIVSFILSSIALWKQMESPSIAYVRTNELVYQYAGMLEAQERYRMKKIIWDQELDSLERDFRDHVDRFNRDVTRLSAGDKLDRKRELALMQRSLEDYRMGLEAKAKKEDVELTQGVLSQVNTFVSAYAEEQGYDVVIGTGESGTIMYGQHDLDITREVLRALNERHSK